MSDDVQPEEVTTKSWFDNAHSEFYYNSQNSKDEKNTYMYDPRWNNTKATKV